MKYGVFEMGTQKIEKKLPDSILALIDEEAEKMGISRQEAISRLISSVLSLKNETEIEHLILELKNQGIQLVMKDEEISYLRTELSNMNQGLSKMAENLTKRNCSIADVDAQVSPMRDEVTALSGEISKMRDKIETISSSSFERHIPLLIIGILAGLLVVYLIVMKL